jgi:hypothetical protein
LFISGKFLYDFEFFALSIADVDGPFVLDLVIFSFFGNDIIESSSAELVFISVDGSGFYIFLFEFKLGIASLFSVKGDLFLFIDRI